ncbi:V-type proton ATPase subunit e1 [Chlorella sorokiniana]|jgi:V-type H+-transporting ATPase subunit e|uniref:V-type proton ATPase subunit e1 n=1 Tax=Chlorella sorokiniana TaxID=3076 RepID=A0A2P6TJ20_CHLSO|nr:V-type proton ATPase subunit e1 [Chlorella sorokiniana]|eukprot:PRW39219.1 V-type proton ATPase subunit e1 [Chlorella sorokiniana]
MGFWLGTVVFLVLEALGFSAVQFSSRPQSTKLLNHTLVASTIICCWLMWSIVYLAQMHPLIRPILQG